MLPATASRVREHTSERVNESLRRQTVWSIARYAGAEPEAIDRRLAELEQEWDVERVLQTNFAAVTLVGTALGALVDRRWYLFSAVAAGFMVMHALQGWCPPVPVIRRLGYRTAAEIDHERYALKALRGDFDHLDGGEARRQAGEAFRAAQARPGALERHA